MTALTQDRDTKERKGQFESYPVEANTIIYAGALVALDANNYAVPASAAPGLVVIGRAERQVNNLNGAGYPANVGTAGALNVRVQRGVFLFNNSAGGDAITLASIGQNCYAVDDNTVALTSGAGTRSIAGKIYDVDATTGEVWVDTRKPDAPRKSYIVVNVADLISADAHTYYVASPAKGRITKLQSAISAALATGDATITAKIAGVAVTNGAIDVVQAGSAAGQVNVANPTAANAVDIGSLISLTVGGANTGAGNANVTIEITE